MRSQGTESSSALRRGERSHRPGAAATSAGARGTAGSVVARFAGGVALLIVIGTVVTGLTVSARSARNERLVRARSAELLRAPLVSRLRTQARELAARVAEAEADDDWSVLQAELPRRVALDPDLVRALISDEEGLVLADAEPSRNGLPVREESLRARLHQTEPSAWELGIDGTPGLLVLERYATKEGRVRIIALVGTRAAELAVDAALATEAEAERRVGWLLVVLGGFLCAAVAVGSVVVVGSSIARRLHIVAWRISELGQDDRGTHVRLGGPAELEHVEHELERAARRLSLVAASEAMRREAEALRATVRRIALAGEVPEQRVGALRVSCSREEGSRSVSTVAVRSRADGAVLVVLVEVLGASLDEALLVAELRGAILAGAGDEAVGPAALLGRLDLVAGPTRRARVLALQISATGTLQLASAGARFPILVTAAGKRTLVVRGDRLGEPGAVRESECSATLAPTERIELHTEGSMVFLSPEGRGATPTLRVTIARDSAA